MELVQYEHGTPAFAADWLLDPAEIAQRIGGTDFVPRGLRDNPAAITAALLYGAEIGLGRMASLATIAIIDGKPTLSAEAQRALILAAGHSIWMDEATQSRAVACGQRRGQQTIRRVTWTIDDARRAGLAGRNNWRTYPRQMLVARATAELARELFPDVIHGLMASEELEGGDGVAPGAEPTPPEDKPTTTRRRRRRGAGNDSPEGDATASGDRQTRAAGEAGAEGSGPSESRQAGDLAENVPPPPEVQASPVPDPELAQVEEAGDEVERLVEEFAPTPEAEQAAVDEATDGDDELDRRLRHSFALMREVGLDAADRPARLAYVSKVVGREVPSSGNLTLDEANALVADLLDVQSMPPGPERDMRLLPANEEALMREGADLGTFES